MARRLTFTVDQEPITLEIGGEEFTAPPILGPAALADLLDKRATMNAALTNLGDDVAESGAMTAILGVIARPPTCPHCDAHLTPAKAEHAVLDRSTPLCPATDFPYQPDTGIFDIILNDVDAAQRFRERLYSRDHPFDLGREVMPAISGLIEEYTGRPTPPSSPSSTPSTGDGTSSTDGAPPAAWTPSQISALAAS